MKSSDLCRLFMAGKNFIFPTDFNAHLPQTVSFFKARTLGNTNGTLTMTAISYYTGIICPTLILKGLVLI